MRFAILIPHYKTEKITAYSVSKFLEHKGKHELDIIVIDNNSGDGTIRCLDPFLDKGVKVINYPKGKLQSHGIAQDYALENGYVNTDYFITAETDSFPTTDKYFDEIKKLINEGYDCGGTLMQLSGGQYMHGCGSFYSKKLWQEAYEYCNQIPYTYFPNMWEKEGFSGHTMIHHKVLLKVLTNPEDYFDLAQGYKGLSTTEMLGKADHYSSVVSPFHNGTGMLQESVKTYGQRCPQSEVSNILLNGNAKIIFRVGYEPSQFIHYYAEATNKKVAYIPFETKWMPNRVNQQQEYTKTIHGFCHLWSGSAHLDMKGTQLNDVYEFKHNLINELYESMPQQFKINQ